MYLLGISGELGEDARTTETLELSSGRQATLFSDERHGTWTLAWEDEFPCTQMAVIANGFTEGQFFAGLGEIGILRTRGVAQT